MPPEDGLQGFINTFFQVEALKNQRELLALQQQNARVERARLLTDMGRMTSSEHGRTQLGIMSQDPEVAELLHELSPTVPTMIQEAAVRGFELMAPEERDVADRSAAIQSVTGQTPAGLAGDQLLELFASGQVSDEELVNLRRQYRTQLVGTDPGRLAESVAVADLPPEQLEAAAKIARDLQLGAMSKEQVAQWAIRNNYDLMALAQNGALGMADLWTRVQIADRQIRASTAEGFSVNTALTTMINSLDAAGDNSLSKTQRAAHIQAFNGLADYLAVNGLDIMPGRFDSDPDNVSDDEIISGRNFLMGSVGALVGGTVGIPFGMPFAGALLGGAGGFGLGAYTGDRENKLIPAPEITPQGQLLQGQTQGMEQMLLDFFRAQGLMP